MSDDEELTKGLGLLSSMTIGIGTMIGAGIFVLRGVAAQEAGPIVVLSSFATEVADCIATAALDLDADLIAFSGRRAGCTGCSPGTRRWTS